MSALTGPLKPGDRAPDFTLAPVNREGPISLTDYRGKQAVLIGLFRGLECPFCRRQIFQLGLAHEKLLAAGVETLAIVNMPLDRARRYFAYRPVPLVMLADPDLTVHRAFGLPRIAVRDGEAGDVPADGPLEGTVQLAGHFLIDRDATIRWTHIEGIDLRWKQLRFPTEAELLAAVGMVTKH